MSEIEFASGIVLWKAVLLTAISFAVGIFGGFVGLALGTIRLPAMLLLGMPAPIAGGNKHPRQWARVSVRVNPSPP